MSGEDIIDSVTLRPSWIVPASKNDRIFGHSHNIVRASDDFNNSYGVDIRGGPLRDWNEELQSAREMPRESLEERLERAR